MYKEISTSVNIELFKNTARRMHDKWLKSRLDKTDCCDSWVTEFIKGIVGLNLKSTLFFLSHHHKWIDDMNYQLTTD